jgi:hypothetical protein
MPAMSGLALPISWHAILFLYCCVTSTVGFIARFDCGSNVGSKFALVRDKAVANATAVTGYKIA